jgi:hypothetical protein
MSSVIKPTQQQPSSEITTKKKFGKNLSKLTQPPAPAVSSPPKQSASSRNGLLLLSTKRALSTSNAAPSSGGILSNKSSQTSSKPLPVLGLQYESNTSTHDALLGAIVGASRAEAQHQPDAWGVADKQPKNTRGENDMLSADTNAGKEASEPGTTASQPSPRKEGSPNPAPPQETGNDPNSDAQNSNWEEYGGRNIPSEKDEDIQGLYMSRRAKERAEKHQTEEEDRISQQKERAHGRLKELEEKLGSDDKGDNARDSATVEQPQQRTLYDPNRPFTSKAGGSSARNDKESRLNDVEQPRNGRMMGSPSEDTRDLNKYNRPPMIQLSSYDDRDRGERGSSAGPRMLFDPKSGSMVAVPSREEATSGRGRKERGKKGRNARDKDAKADSRTDNEGSKGVRKGKSRRDENGAQQRGKGAADSSSPSKADSKRGRVVTDQKIPRTCGVLYTKDNKGHYYCVDGSDGDLGYGAHSVPGGKTRNPEAFDKYVNEKEAPEEENKPLDNSRQDFSYKDTLMHDTSDAPEIALQTGFNVVEPEPNLDWVKQDEKISLVDGNSDSPMLQATAKEWAPSQAAVTAAAAAAAERTATFPSSVDSVEDSSEEDDIPVSTNCGVSVTRFLLSFANNN